MKAFLKPGSLCLLLALLAGCVRPFKDLRRSPEPFISALQYKPQVTRTLYRCVVDGRVVFKRFHLSGLLLFKKLDDGFTRVVFQNEMGFTFFDFQWDREDSFAVNHIIPQLDKAAVVRTLEKDLALLLMKGLDSSTEQLFHKGGETLHRFSLESGFAYYVLHDRRLVRIENAGKSKVTTIALGG